MKERWKSISGYEGFYSISSLGRVKSIARTVISTRGQIIKVPERFLSPGVGSHGYLAVMLCRDGKQDVRTIHTLVAFAFVRNPDPGRLTDAEHKNQLKLDNAATNLRWASRRLNNLNRPQIFVPKKINAATGVYRFCGKRGVKYRAYLGGSYLGSFSDLADAMRRRESAYAKAILEETRASTQPSR